MQIGVAYASSEEQIWVKVEVPDNSTAEDAIKRSGLLERVPSIDLSKQKIGIYGKISSLKTALQDGDRVEIYRPIIAQLDSDEDDDDD